MAIKHRIRTEKGHEVIDKLSAKKAIQLFCKECMGWQPKMVRLCEVKDCPLWPFRSHAKPKDTV